VGHGTEKGEIVVLRATQIETRSLPEETNVCMIWFSLFCSLSSLGASLGAHLRFAVMADMPGMAFITEALFGSDWSAYPTVVATITFFGHLNYQSGSKRY